MVETTLAQQSAQDTLTAQERTKAAGERARKEAEERRRLDEERTKSANAPKEIDGRGGLDPVRYDDWEIKGLTADF